MKIQRWCLNTDTQSPVLDPIGAFVRLSDIEHLLPTENPEWEPCNVSEATHVMNARGDARNIDDRDGERVGIRPDLISRYDNWIKFMDLPFYGLTPVKRRKVEPVVFEIEGKRCIGDLYNMVANAIGKTGPGALFRVTVEVVQGEK